MRMFRTVPPTQYPVSLVEVKAHLHIYHSDEDAKLDAFIAAAVNRLDGYYGILNRALLPQTWRLQLDCFPPCIDLPLPPLISIDQFQYLDDLDTWVDVTDSEYQLINNGEVPSVLVPSYLEQAWPTPKLQPDSIRIVFTCGYQPGHVPEDIKSAILMTISTWNENREAGQIPEAVRTLLAPRRTWNS